MTVNNSNIDQVIKTLRQAVTTFSEPSVTLVGRRWSSPFHVLISCLLSLRTRDETTLPASLRLFRAAETPEELLKLPLRRIEKLIYPVGFYRTKARTLHAVAGDLIKRFGGRVPDSIDELLTLKGVGRKTANLVMTEGFHRPAICVDTHVHRISNRFGYVRTRTPNETEGALRKKLPKEYWIDYNALLVTWGQNVCKPISPLCSGCVVNKVCRRAGVTLSR